MRSRLAWRSRERGFLALIGLLVVIVIIGVMFVVMYGMPVSPTNAPGPAPGSGTVATTVLGAAKERAEQSVCRNNLQQFRQAIGVYQANGEGNPPDLESLKLGLPAACPDGGEPYQYDPISGQVHCIQPGHGSF